MTRVMRASDPRPATGRKPVTRRLYNSGVAVGLTVILIAVCFLVGFIFGVAPWLLVLIGAAAIGIPWLMA